LRAPAPFERATPPARAAGAAFAQGASGRLLPLSVPMRFFGAAAAFHLFAWIALGLGAVQVPRFSGGMGWPLAALHAITLGTLAMSAIGASLQLMPVATRQALGSRRAPLVVWWLYAPGVAALVAGMAAQRPLWMAVAALPVIAALVLYGVLLARNLAGARGMPGVRAMGWLALMSLVIACGSAGAMVATWAGWASWLRQGLLMLHIVSALFGFMGALALGLSNILVPMFALGPLPAQRAQLGIAALVAAALVLTVPVALGAWRQPALLAAVGLALAAVAWHLGSMRQVMRAGMRRELGGSFRLVRLGWGGLIAALALTVWWALDPEWAGTTTALVACAVMGWLMSFLFGILQRIVPFLVSMHLAGTGRRAPTPSGLTDERALGVHRIGHAAALVLTTLAIAGDSVLAAYAASLAGVVGALGFLVFFVVVLRRARRARDGQAAGAARAAR
jgi:hypothetical protein